MRLIAVIAFAALAAASSLSIAQAQDPRAGLSERQKQEVEKLIGEYLRTHPEVILESLRAMQEREQADQLRRQQDGLTSRREQIVNDPTSPVVGNPKGNVTIVEFFDYRCSYCKAVLPSVQRLLKDDSNIRYVMKELPILSPESRIAAMLALAAWKIDPKRYMALHIKLMETRGELSEKRIFDIAKDVGLDVERLRREMGSDAIGRALAGNLELAQTLGISGTPAFIVGTRILPGAVDYETLKQVVAEARGAR